MEEGRSQTLLLKKMPNCPQGLGMSTSSHSVLCRITATLAVVLGLKPILMSAMLKLYLVISTIYYLTLNRAQSIS